MGIMCVINGVGGNGVLWDCVGSKRCVCDFWR